MAIKSGRGNVKGSGIRSPPPPCTYSLSNSTRKEAVSKKNSILMSDPPKIRKSIFHIRKKVYFWPLASHGIALKPSLRSGFKAMPFEPGKMLFFSCEKCIYCFWSVFYKKNTIICKKCSLSHGHGQVECRS